MTDRDAAAKLALCKWLKGRVAEWEAEAKAELGEMVPGDRQAALLHGYKIGAVTMCQGRREFHVTDDAGFALWVQGRWPHQVEVVMQVYPAFQRSLAERALKHGALIDEDGEVCPFAEIIERDPYTLTKLEPGAESIVLELMQRNKVLELMEGQPSDD